MAFHDLSNENIVFLYLENKRTLTQFNKVIKDQGIKHKVDMPIFGVSVHTHPVSEETITKMKECLLVKQLQEIDKVLEPIVLLIKDSDPDLYKRIEDSTQITFTL